MDHEVVGLDILASPFTTHVGSIADPSVFTYTPARVEVETHGTLTSGMTVTDFTPSTSHNTQVAMAVDADRFWTIVLDAYSVLPVAQG